MLRIFSELYQQLVEKARYLTSIAARLVSPYNVSELVGLTVEMLEKHHAPFVPELCDHVRMASENGSRLESIQPEVRKEEPRAQSTVRQCPISIKNGPDSRESGP